jgi:predicted acyltransferase
MKNNEAVSKRVVSIDALRGFDMFWITGGDSIFPALFALLGAPFFMALSRQLEHSAWNGFTFYDLIFPLFMFIMGASMPFSLSKYVERGDLKGKLYGHVIKRSLSLFVLGLIYNGLLDFNFAQMRYAGVLQRFAICYFFAALIIINVRKPKNQAIWAGGILLFYWAIMALIPVPGHGMGVLTPEGNLASYIDRLLLPGRFCCFELGDNEGILSSIPAISTVLLGALAGHLLRADLAQTKKALYLAIGGAGSLVIALIWNFVFPINKLIWSSSYVLFAGGWSLLLLALFYWIIDVRGHQKWAFPFVIIGMNSITIYIVQGLFDFGVIANIFVHGFINHLGDWKPLFWALCVFAVKWLFLLFLYKKKIFLKV